MISRIASTPIDFFSFGDKIWTSGEKRPNILRQDAHFPHGSGLSASFRFSQARERAGHFTRSVVSLEYVGMGQLPLGDVRAEQSLQLFVARQKRKYISHCRPCLSANLAFVRMELLYQIIAAMSNGNAFLKGKYGFFFYLRIKREENVKIAPQCDIFIVRRGIKYK